MGGLPGVDLGGLAEEVAHLVGAPQEHQLRERVDVEREVLVAGQVDDLRLEVDGQLDVRVALPRARTAAVSRSGSTMIGSRPFLSALPWKMSAQLVVMTAWTPQATSAQGACSRDEPQPKLSPAMRIRRPDHLGLVEDEPAAP